jgi:hypothetical protein
MHVQQMKDTFLSFAKLTEMPIFLTKPKAQHHRNATVGKKCYLMLIHFCKYVVHTCNIHFKR